MDNPEKKLHPLLRLAVISGVETAVKLHIRRGDDLDARDGTGATPLMLAAARKKKGVVKLLLDAGADATIVGPDGRNALAHALAAGCPTTIDLLTKASMPIVSGKAGQSEPSPVVVIAREPAPSETDNLVSRADNRSSLERQRDFSAANPISSEPMATVDVPFVEFLVRGETTDGRAEPPAPVLDDEMLDLDFVDGWEAEKESVAPEGDQSVVEGIRLVHMTISGHEAINTDEDWGDIDLYLPDRAAPLQREDGDGFIRELLLGVLREGTLSEDELVEVCLNADGTRNGLAERLLGVVAADLGATFVEWVGAAKPFRTEPSIDENRTLDEAIAFAADLGSGRNDPFRFYSKAIRGDLLEAEEEIALSREIEDAGNEALVALAQWPEGLALLFAAAERVSGGDADAESYSTGPEPSSDDDLAIRQDVTETEEDEGACLDDDALAFVMAVEAVRHAEGDPDRVLAALTAVRLTRGFLFSLTERTDLEPAGMVFADALARQSVAREKMILSNLRLALSIAKRYLWSGIPFDDLVQEANIGLMKAVERYDWRRGFRFSTYATWWIRQQVTRAIANTARIVRVPVHVQEAARKVIRERADVEARLGRPESELETARRIGRSLSRTKLLLGAFDEAESLDEFDSETGLSRLDLLIDPDVTDPAEIAEQASLRTTLMKMLTEFDDRSREVMMMRFGLGDLDAMTLEEVGQQFGVTRERIRQIESKAMRKLSHPSRREILWPFMGDGYAPPKLSPAVGGKRLIMPPPADDDGEYAHVSRLDAASQLGEEARNLGFQVDDKRATGGELRIVTHFDFSAASVVFRHRLIVAGFCSHEKDVFVKR